MWNTLYERLRLESGDKKKYAYVEFIVCMMGEVKIIGKK